MENSAPTNEQKIVQVFKLPISCYFLKSSFSRINGCFEHSKEGDAFIVLKPKSFVLRLFDICDIPQISKSDIIDGSRALTTSLDYGRKEAVMDNILRTFPNPIEGYEVLNLSSMEKLWISKYDMEVLVEYLDKNGL